MDDEHILEGLHHRIENLKRDVIAKIQNNETFESIIITEIVELRDRLIKISDQNFEIISILIELKEEVKSISNKIRD